jgi:hypothetical protein
MAKDVLTVNCSRILDSKFVADDSKIFWKVGIPGELAKKLMAYCETCEGLMCFVTRRRDSRCIKKDEKQKKTGFSYVVIQISEVLGGLGIN